MRESMWLKAAIAAIALTAAGCSTSPRTPATTSSGPAYSSVAYGTVQSIETVAADRSASGIGAAAGAVAGGVLGNQVGSGSGRTAATVGGAVAGGLLGNEAEKRIGSGGNPAYRVQVRLDDGSLRTVTQDTANNLRVGGRVRVEGDRVYPL